MVLLNALLAATALAGLAGAAPGQSVTRRQISPDKLHDKYDIVIAGGGTSGLTVADRFTAAFPNKKVLVIEYGVIEYAPGSFDPPATVWGGPGPQASKWTFSSLPNEEVDNKTALVLVGKVVGGSSAINGMFFDRGSRHDFDAWAKAGSPDFDASPNKWDANGLFSYFKKAVTFTPPPADVVNKYHYTWDISAYGGTTPIYSSFPPFLWADYFTGRGAWSDMGIPTNPECASGHKTGLCWVPLSADPVRFRRSHSELGHYAAVNTTRPNYDLLVSHQVVRVVYPQHPGAAKSASPPLVEIKSLADGTLRNITAASEVIISAGALNTPMILHRSGIGPAGVLKKYGIPVVLDLPGAGSNFHDHSGPAVSWNYTKPTNFYPMPSDMLNATFAAEATKEFDEVPARGPYTLGMSNVAIFVSLPDLASNSTTITAKIRALAADAQKAASYLPADYRSDPTMVAGYQQQLSVLADFFDNSESPSLESGFATGTTVHAINLHQLSRGTVRLNTTDPLGQPILDYRVGTNPIDWDVYLAHTRYLRRMIPTATLQKYGAVEAGPGAAVQSDQDLIQYIKDTMIFSYMHPCCTAAMLPKSKGGVVGPDLKVHGAAGLRVIDMSILPFLPSSHLSQTAYAVGEKAADILIQEYKGKGW